LQHFKGFFIQTEEDVFDPETATFMDFEIEQGGEVRFFYVLPSDKRNALVEIAIFSEKIWNEDQYDLAIEDYIDNHLKLKNWKIKEMEFGIIPMTNYPFNKHQGKRLIQIGTAGGQVQGSTGFAFKNMQQNAMEIVENLAAGTHPVSEPFLLEKRYKLYDDILLGILKKKTLVGKDIFTNIFKNNPTERVFNFLNRSSSIKEDLSLMSKLPQWPFFASMLRTVKNNLLRRI
ncbi:MAG: lycopene cyclase family protein, partial [Saprospiraceae bacterium]